MKALILAGAASILAAPAAMAGPYVEIENNAGFAGSDYTGAVTETHVGYEGALGESSSWYIQGGTAFVSPDGGDTTTELSGKVGLSVAATENLSVYGEIAAMTNGEIDFDEDLSVGTKVGVRYSF